LYSNNTITCWGGKTKTDINTVHITQKSIIQVAYSLLSTYPAVILSYKHAIYLWIKQSLIRSVQRHIFNDIETIDSITGIYIKPHSATSVQGDVLLNIW